LRTGLAPARARNLRDEGRPGVDARRVARFAVLLAWAGFFAWLRASGEITRYIGPRTYWVVSFGGVTLALAALGNLLAIRTRGATRPLSFGEMGGMVVLAAPIMAVALVPSAQLGALAASRKAISGLASSTSLIPSAHDASKGVSVVDIHYASESPEYAESMGISDGYRIDLLGFVTHPSGTPRGRFALTRFFVSCCAADAIPYSVQVDPAKAGMRGFTDNTWLDISGALYKEGEEYVLVAQRINKTRAPKDPYLY
jgi:putative membrane protein